MLVMFTIRGMAYGLTDVPEDLERKLRDYEIKINSLPKRDVRVCQNILHIFRLQNNNKDIPVIESLSDSTSESSHEVMDDTAFYQSDEEDIDLRKLPEEIMDSVNSNPIGSSGHSGNGGINRDALPTEVSDSMNSNPISSSGHSGSGLINRNALPTNLSDSMNSNPITGSGHSGSGLINRNALPTNLSDSMRSKSSISSGSTSTDSEERQQRGGDNDNGDGHLVGHVDTRPENFQPGRDPATQPESLGGSTNQNSMAASGYNSLKQGDKQHGGSTQVDTRPEDVDIRTINSLSTEDKQSDDNYSRSDALPEDVLPGTNPALRPEEFVPGVPESGGSVGGTHVMSFHSVDPFQHLRHHWDPLDNWEPLPIEDQEFETEKDCEFPFLWDDTSPLTLDDRIQRMVDALHPKSTTVVPKPPSETSSVSSSEDRVDLPSPEPQPPVIKDRRDVMKDMDNMGRFPDSSELHFQPIPLSKATFPSRKPSPYIIALFVVLMLCCVAGFITCGVLLAKIN